MRSHKGLLTYLGTGVKLRRGDSTNGVDLRQRFTSFIVIDDGFHFPTGRAYRTSLHIVLFLGAAINRPDAGAYGSYGIAHHLLKRTVEGTDMIYTPETSCGS